MSLAVSILFVFGFICYLVYQHIKSGDFKALFDTIVGNYSDESIFVQYIRQQHTRICTEIELGTGKVDHVFDFFGGMTSGRMYGQMIASYLVWLAGGNDTSSVGIGWNFEEDSSQNRMKIANEIYEFSKQRKPITQKRRDEISLALDSLAEFKDNGHRPVSEATLSGILFNELLKKYPETMIDCAKMPFNKKALVQKVMRSEFLCPRIPANIRNVLIPFSSFDRAEEEYLIFAGYDFPLQRKILSACQRTVPSYIVNGHKIDVGSLSKEDAENFSLIYPDCKDILDSLTVYQLDPEVLTAQILGRQNKRYEVNTKTFDAEVTQYKELIQKLRRRQREYALKNNGTSWLASNRCYLWLVRGNEYLDQLNKKRNSEQYKKREKTGKIGKICGWVSLAAWLFIRFSPSDFYYGVSVTANILIIIDMMCLFGGLTLWIYLYWYKYRISKDNDEGEYTGMIKAMW